MGHLNRNEKSVRIMTSIKLKHIGIENFIKKDKICLKISVCGFSHETERIHPK